MCGRHRCDPNVHVQADVTGFRSVIRDDLGLHGDLVAQADPLAALQLVTHMFVHADFFHILGNMIILLAFALPFEERVGPRAFTWMYLLSGLVAAFAQMGTAWGEAILMVGASGAVFGIIGAFAGAYPNLVLPLPIPIGIIIFVRMRVIIAAGIAAVMQVVMVSISSAFDNTAYFAHLGGLVAGLVIAWTYVRSRGAGHATPIRLDIDAMAPFAGDAEGIRALDHMRMSRDEPEVFEAWLQRFLRSARSPSTGAPVALRKGELVSTRGERYDVRVR